MGFAMLKFMKKIPAGTLIVPMFISALINTIFPGFFASLTGSASALFAGGGTGFIIGVLSLVSGAMLDITSLKHILKKQGILILIKLVIAFVIGTIIIRILGNGSILGISSIALMVGLVATNPAVYLAIVSENGTTEDEGAFSILGLICLPIFPMMIYALSFGGNVPYTSLLHAFIPVLLGFIIGNLDKDFVKFTAPSIGILMPFLGWNLGANINLFDAIIHGFSGIFIVVIIYVFISLPLYLFERNILKHDGVSAVAINIVAGVSIAAASALGGFDPSLAPMLPTITAQVSFATVSSSLLTPIICRWLKKQSSK